VDDDESVVVIFGDCIYDSEVSAVSQLIEAYEEFRAPIIGMTKVDRKEVSKFGVIDGEPIDEKEKHWKISRIVEKPEPEDSPTTIVAPGKYIITHEVFKILAGMNQGASGEIRLADAFALMLEKKIPIYGRMLEGEWLDTGDKFNFLRATIHFGLKHPEVGEKLRNYLKGLEL
jgi:UTP--glucose-1-phosphate uridylyltransferase